MVMAMRRLVILAALAAIAAAPAAVAYEKDAVVLPDGARVGYHELVAGAAGILNGEKFPLPVQEWDAASSRNAWRRPAVSTPELPGLWRSLAGAWMGWKGGALVKKACRKDACTLTVVLESGEARSSPYTIGVTAAGGALSVDAIECAGPVRAVLKLIERGEAQWRPYAKALALPEDSAPSSEYAVEDHCYLAPSDGQQPAVRVRLGAVSGRIDTIVVTQGPWPGVTATFGGKKIESVARQRVGE
jgi:hypothetical protein